MFFHYVGVLTTTVTCAIGIFMALNPDVPVAIYHWAPHAWLGLKGWWAFREIERNFKNYDAVYKLIDTGYLDVTVPVNQGEAVSGDLYAFDTKGNCFHATMSRGRWREDTGEKLLSRYPTLAYMSDSD